MRLHKLLKIFIRNKHGYVAVLFGIMAVPLVGLIGAAVDYQQIGREYAGLRTAAEAAAVAVARSRYKPTRITFLDPVEDPTTLMTNVFNSNFTNDPAKFTYVTPTLTEVDDTEKSVTITATAGAKTSLLRMIGFETFDISVVAKAAAVFSTENVQVHFVIDLSPSMGAPTDGTAPPLTPNQPDGCFFMCHDDGTAIRNAGKTPKMDTIFSRLGSVNGMAYLIATAAGAGPVPVTARFWGHSFDHHLYPGAFFSNVTNGDVKARFVDQPLPRYYLGDDGKNGGTDLNASFAELHTYLSVTNPLPASTRRIVIIISDGMHARAPQPFDPAACTALKADGAVYTLYVNNPEDVYRNPNLTYVVPGGPQSGTAAVDTWDWMTLLGGGDTPYGYYSGLNNAENLMRSCASEPELAYTGETGTEITEALDQMTENIIAPEIRVIH